MPASGESLTVVPFPSQLRKDGLAETYLDGEGRVCILPIEPHDFSFSQALHAEGLSSAVVDEGGGAPLLRYDGADLIPLSAVLNSALATPDGRQEVARSAEIAANTLRAIQRKFGYVPLINSIDGIAIDRANGRAELLPPYHVSASLTARVALRAVFDDAVSRSTTAVERSVIQDSFMPEISGLED